jgi:hypothetical protein
VRRLSILILFVACKRLPDRPPITAPWTDTFERASIGPDYYPTADVYRIQDGALTVAKAHNHPLWLRKRIPADATIELDVWATTPDGDLKIEAWGDGSWYEPADDTQSGAAYVSSGYVFIHGGWHNTKSVLARGNEHTPDEPERTDRPVVMGRHEHWKIVRKGGHIDWFVDDMATPFLSFDDPKPLGGKDHSYIGLDDWESNAWFDNLSVTPSDAVK